MDRNPGRDQYDDKNYKMEEYSKALHQSDVIFLHNNNPSISTTEWNYI